MELLKALFEQSVKKSWLKAIGKEVNKYNRINEKLNRQAFVVNTLVKRYREIYGEDLRARKEGGTK